MSPKKKVLIVDDSRTVREQVAAALTPAGFAVLEAENGAEALNQIKAVPDLALIFCDLNMPKMNGLEMLREAAKMADTKVPHIVMLTSEGRADLIEEAKKAGARGWLVKPFRAEHLIAVARKLAL
jgi:two-component system chemotaxis response regulator CheY